MKSSTITTTRKGCSCLLRFELLFLVTLGIQINHSVTALILSVGEKCDNFVNSETSNSGIDPPICDPSMPLECSEGGRCQCKRGFTISRNGTRCLEIARNGLDSFCHESIQCWKGLLGRLSECRRDTGRCRCYESETLPIIYHKGRCYYGESLFDFCQIDGLCEATTPNAECRTTCQCKEGYIQSWDKTRCLKIAIQGLNSTCEENVQCEKSALGTLSECNQEIMQCRCYQIPILPTVFYAGRCYFGAALGDVCQIKNQCTSVTKFSTCSKDGKCVCSDGHTSNGNQSLCLQIPSDGSFTGLHQCDEDIQCIKALGHFARCNPSNRKCECYVPHEQGGRRENETTTFSSITTAGFGGHQEEPVTAMVIIGSKCHSVKYLGQSCKWNKQCSSSTQNSVCYNGICHCREESHVPSMDGRKCLEIANGISSYCDEDNQCTKSLGHLSKCEKNKCECSNVLPVVYYDKKCYFHRQLGCINGTEPFTDHSCRHSSSESSSMVFRNFLPINSGIASIITVLCVKLFH